MRAQEDFRIFAFEEKFMLLQLILQEKNDA